MLTIICYSCFLSHSFDFCLCLSFRFLSEEKEEGKKMASSTNQIKLSGFPEDAVHLSGMVAAHLCVTKSGSPRSVGQIMVSMNSEVLGL